MTGTLRLDFADWCLEQLALGALSLWGARGRYFIDEKGLKRMTRGVAYDCSGLVVCGLYAVTGLDHRADWSAQVLADECPPTDEPRIGDLGVYGGDSAHVVHVVIALAGGHCIGAEGATRLIRTPDEARARGRYVKLLRSHLDHTSAPWVGWRTNKFLEEEPQTS